MAKRHFVADKGDHDLALTRMKNAINFFDKIGVNEMRRCFSESDNGGSLDKMRKMIEADVAAGRLSVCGRDISGRAIHVVVCRNKITDDLDALLRGHIYMIERTIAITERRTNGKVEKSIVAYDFSDVKPSHALSLKSFRAIGAALQDFYPERLHCTYMIDVPNFFRYLWNLFSPFLDPVTKKKVVFVNGEAEKEKLFGSIMDEKDVMPYIRPGGKMLAEVDMPTFLYKVPFDYGFGEDPNSSC